MRGESVTILTRSEQGRDELNAPVMTWVVEAVVDDVLVAPATTTDLTGAIRPDGTRADLTLHMPKTYTGPLRGRRVRVRGGLFEVVGDPQHYEIANTPGRWNRPVDVKEVLG
ncbi:hypothetical protein [Actinomyces urogenitalis]|uniref:hypothetical protein n=1 Tax=Actinomyces urogenitalis TaxID=103621 RepID=UPI00189A6253|nr:hypothetical protein [Actinomyces urogenitalis]